MEKCRELVKNGSMTQEMFDKIVEVTDIASLPERTDYRPQGLIRGYRRERKEKR